jgi:hypothetical protein
MIRDAPVLDDAAPEDAHHIEHVDSESATAWRMVLLPVSHVRAWLLVSVAGGSFDSNLRRGYQRSLGRIHHLAAVTPCIVSPTCAHLVTAGARRAAGNPKVLPISLDKFVPIRRPRG